MYLPRHFAETDSQVLHALIRAHPLGTWVTHGDGELVANHIPFLVDPARGEFGTLTGHVARANPVWQSFSGGANSLVVFQGPQTYITPSWYPGKAAHGKVVPTWNYAVVHAYGLPRAIEDRDWLLQHVSELTSTHEARQAHAWKVGDAPADFIARQLQAIVGVEIPIAKIAGKWKVSQNRVESDRLGVIAGLTGHEDTQSRDMATLVRARLSRKPGE